MNNDEIILKDGRVGHVVKTVVGTKGTAQIVKIDEGEQKK